MSRVLSDDMAKFLEDALDVHLPDWDVVLHGGNEKGEGFLGDMLFVSLKRRTAEDEHHLVIKQVLPCDSESATKLMSMTYRNEIHVYQRILPALRAFREAHPEVGPFDVAPRCYGADETGGEEKICFRNAKYDGYEMHPKKDALGAGLMEEVFRKYGRLHAAGFAFKGSRPEEFDELKAGLRNNWAMFASTPFLSASLKGSAKTWREALLRHDEPELAERLEKYVEKADKIFIEAVSYTGKYGVFLHGDAWSNNLMFKYDDKKQLENIFLIDFQMSSVGSPVLDLSYSFYACADYHSMLDKLDEFLEVYHKSLSEELLRYGSKAEEVYPFDVMKEEWKKYSVFGLFMGSLMCSMKHRDTTKELPDVNKILNDSDAVEKYGNDYNDEYAKTIVLLLRHALQNDFL
ncbi:unnamed protein product [Phyllotreta striolata]|uniref:CHK kinase-like domain-containing protein n=1 Tax=Phyllotreta striolata TaxID=444603 RepID=A0A9N9XPF5_PHYSR|nr:unnamed protein product [Phyllotreta striolata]